MSTMTDPPPKGDGLLTWLAGGLVVGLALLGGVVLAYSIGYERGQDDVAAAPITQPAVTEPVTTTTSDGPDGATVFAQAGCGSCHTLAAAGAAGTVGPNLDQLAPTKEAVATIVTSGRAAMPSFADQLDAEEIEAVAEYVAESAG